MTADRIIYASVAALIVLALLSFFKIPAYEKGVWFVLGAIGTALSGALGFKFGVTNPAGKPVDKKEDLPKAE